jgi:hypothetical protein
MRLIFYDKPTNIRFINKLDPLPCLKTNSQKTKNNLQSFVYVYKISLVCDYRILRSKKPVPRDSLHSLGPFLMCTDRKRSKCDDRKMWVDICVGNIGIQWSFIWSIVLRYLSLESSLDFLLRSRHT